MRIDFRDAYCRWHIPVSKPNEPRLPDELHVKAKTAEVRKQLRTAIEQIVSTDGHSPTRYKVEREVDGVFVLTNARVQGG